MPNGQGFLDRRAANTSLRCAKWIYFYNHLTSVFSFRFQFLEEVAPSRIVDLFRENTFGQTRNVEFLNRCQVIFFDQTGRSFVSKIVSLIFDFLVNPAKFRRGFSFLMTASPAPRNFSPGNSQLFLSSFKVFEIVNLSAVAQSHQRFNSHINADLFSCFRQRLFFIFNREDGKPTRNFTLDCASFNFPDHAPRKADFDLSDFGQKQVVAVNPKTSISLWKGERIVSVSTFETWKTGFFLSLYTTKERFESFVKTFERVLQNLRIHIIQISSKSLDVGQMVLLILIGNRNAIEFVGFGSFLKRGVIKFTAQIQSMKKFKRNVFRYFKFEFVSLYKSYNTLRIKKYEG